MNNNKISRFCSQCLIVLLSVLALQSCDPYQKILKSDDYDLKLEKAKEFYNKEQFDKAVPLLEELIAIQKGTKNVEKYYYYHAFCHYGMKDYILAAYYFGNFLDYYPKSVYAEHAQYMVAYCYYKMSPKPSLEQTYTEKAVESFQLFVNTYPYSDRVEKCNELMDNLRTKLEQKAFDAAQLYYNLRTYQASATSFKNMLLKFPDTDRKEEIMFLIIKSYYLFAQQSISTKQVERYNQAMSQYIEFVDQYPESEYIREAEKIYSNSLKAITKIETAEQ